MSLIRSRAAALVLAWAAMMGLILSSATGGETPRLTHVSHDTLVTMPFDDVFILGGTDFRTEFNRLDGFGDPSRPGFNRVRGPDANACVGCHDKVNDDKGHVSAFGGTGDIVVIELMPPPKALRVLTRKPPTLFGAGAVQLLAEEMTATLQAIRAQALQQAQSTGQPVTVDLRAKGVNFGQLVAL